MNHKKTEKEIDFNKYNIANRVMDQIHKENIKIKPKKYFILLKALKKISFVIALFLAVYLTNVVLFKFRIYNPFGFLVFGSLGFTSFLASIPWKIMFFSLLMFGMFMNLVKQYDFSYKRNLFHVAFAVIFLMFTFGFMIDKIGINENIKSSKRLPVLYQGTYASDYFVMGEILTVDNYTKEMIVETLHEEIVKVKWDSSTLLPSGSDFKTHDYLQIIGDKKSGYFQAIGIVKGEEPY